MDVDITPSRHSFATLCPTMGFVRVIRASNDFGWTLVTETSGKEEEIADKLTPFVCIASSSSLPWSITPAASSGGVRGSSGEEDGVAVEVLDAEWLCLVLISVRESNGERRSAAWFAFRFMSNVGAIRIYSFGAE